MKKLIILLIFLEVLPGEKVSAQAIDPLFFGSNYWYAIPKLNTHFSPTVWTKVVNSGCKVLRNGGIDPNLTNPMIITASDYRTKVVDTFSAHGMTAIIQLPFNGNFAQLTTQAAFAKSVVADLKANGYGGLMHSIANEAENPAPNLGYGYNLDSVNRLDEDKVIQYS